MKVNIYLASSVRGFRKKDGVVGFILEADGKKDHTLTQFGKVEQVTENVSYLRALKYALKRITKECTLTIWTDNRYMANAFEQGWLTGWIENDWKNKKGKAVANREEWQEIVNLLNETVPDFRVGAQHQYKNWMNTEVERRNKKYV